MLVNVLLVGAAIGILFHWFECLIRPSLYNRKIRWIIMVRIPEGIVIASALKVFGVI